MIIIVCQLLGGAHCSRSSQPKSPGQMPSLKSPAPQPQRQAVRGKRVWA